MFKILVAVLLTTAAMANTKVLMKTNKGDIELELFDKAAPVTVKNFLGYVKSGFYKGTIFHRVIDNFMIQGGGFTSNLKKKTTREPIKNEADNGLGNDTGTIAMARTSDVHSATAQFFINVQNNAFLNHRSKDAAGYGYAVFGKVTKGMSVVNQIKKTRTTRNGPFANLPASNIIINDMVIKK
ncbi:peptidylprolyl isomerase [Bacteriovorax sp. DB6_IX]|uniref:peptidylprolyl isomerase n=1 Tax=Bacteriovorax sp. DB6_IX TaxID=1353530 RepID=UPI00038A1B55|nr:peptidylprolyl isomerase [Bacteriovorax sp. DB6_IX]EQC52532.1 peptidyl-prolyl cis-trans isomerase A [Bacteriovorax sp. DB6_IX]